MSDVPARKLYMALLVAASLAPSTAHAQQAPARATTLEEQRARVATIGRLVTAAKAAVDSQTRFLNAQMRYDTVRVGALTVVAWPEEAPVVRSGAALAWERLSPALRGDSALLNREWFFLRLGSAAPARQLVTTHPARSATVPGTAPDARAVRDQLVTMVGQSLADASGSLRNWIGGSVPLRDDLSLWMPQVYRELVTAPSFVVHRCYAGDLGACRTALAVDSLTDPATAWYAPGEREGAVRRFDSYNGSMLMRDPVRRGALSRCLELHDDWSCVAFLHTLSHDLRPPLSNAARSTLTRAALDSAPPGAYTRLVTTPGTPGVRLAAAAGVPIDSVVAKWRTRVMAAHPPSPRVGAGTQWSTLLWVVVLGALALRSSRWR